VVLIANILLSDLQAKKHPPREKPAR